MGMYENLKDINSVLRTDETLLRLLFYPPKDVTKNIKDPLDESLPNILDKTPMELKVLRDKRIMVTPKSDDLVNEPICRVYLYGGRRKPVDGYYHANQQVVIDILCHETFETDLRISRISDQICDLLINKQVTGIGKVKYIDGRLKSAPSNYVGYSLVFEVGVVDGI